MNFAASDYRSASLAAKSDVPRNYRILLWAALALMVASRLALILLIDVKPSSDMGWYYARAVGLLETGRYAEGSIPTAYWPVGYPAFLAGVMALAGTSVLVGQLANLALSVACMILLYQLCLRYFDDHRIATIAACLLAVYPNHMGYSLGLYSEPLFTALLLLVWVLTKPDVRLGMLIVVGVAAGLATLVKTQMLLLAPLLIFVLSLRSWTRPAIVHALRQSVLATAVMVATISPWTWRNYVELGAFVPVSTNGGMSLLAGNNPSMTLDLRTDYNDTGIRELAKFSVADQVAADRRARAAAWAWIQDNPLTFMALVPKKFIRFWLPDGESEWNVQMGFADYEKWKVWFRSARVANQLYYFALLAGFAYGLYHCVRLRDPQTLAVPLAALYFTALSLVFSGQSRYHAPLMPFIVAYAAWALVRWRSARNSGLALSK